MASENEAAENVIIWMLFYKEELDSEMIWYSGINVLGEESRSKIS